MANVFKVVDMSDRSNLSPVIAGSSSNLAEKKDEGVSPVTESHWLEETFLSTKYQSIEF